MRRVLAIFTTVFFIFSVSTTSTIIAESAQLTITSSDSVLIAPGADFQVDVIALNATNLVGFQLKLVYDDSQFTFVNVTKSSALGNSITVNTSVSGEILLNYVDISKKVNGDQALFTITFTASQTVNAGEHSILTEDNSYNNEFISMDNSNNISEFTNVIYDFSNVQKGLYGDVNLDESISIMDAALVQLYIADLLVFTSTEEVLADVNRDSSISVADVALIQLYIAGLITTLDPS